MYACIVLNFIWPTSFKLEILRLFHFLNLLMFPFKSMQTRRLSSTSDIDNSPESFLVFDGNKNVQGLYDILLNYRYVNGK